MSGERENHENQSDSMDQTDPAKAEIEERLRKKEKELKQISSRIELLRKERELDEKINQANRLESLYINRATNDRIAYAIKGTEKDKEANRLTTANLVSALQGSRLDEKEEKLFTFAMRTIAEENVKVGLYDTVVMLFFNRNKSVKVSKGTETQRMIIFFDEDNKPAFRWEVKISDSKK